MVTLMPGVPALVGSILLVAFILGEGRLRQGVDARSRVAEPADKGTTRVVGAAFAVCLVTYVLTSFLAAAGVAPLPAPLAWAGVVAMVLGVTLRVWAAAVLGTSYTRTLRVQDTQELVRSGPYAFVRHPGYAGTVLMWTGASLASGDALAPIVIVPVILWAYAVRISAEERMLETAFGESFRDYARKTRSLVPFIY